MAKRKNTIQDIIDIDMDDIIRMDTKSLKAITNKLVSAANKRLRRLKTSDYGTLSPVYRKDPFSTRGKKSRSALIKEYKEAKTYLTAKTSSVRGWNRYRGEMETRIGGKLPKGKAKKFWRVYRKFAESNYGGIQAVQKGSERMQRFIRSEYIDNKVLDEDELLESAEKALNDYYINQ